MAYGFTKKGEIVKTRTDEEMRKLGYRNKLLVWDKTKSGVMEWVLDWAGAKNNRDIMNALKSRYNLRTIKRLRKVA